MATHIKTATTTYVHTKQGHIENLTVGETTSGKITIYDGAVADDIVVGNILGVLQASVLPGEYFTDVTFVKGLIIVTAGASLVTVQTSSATK